MITLCIYLVIVLLSIYIYITIHSLRIYIRIRYYETIHMYLQAFCKYLLNSLKAEQYYNIKNLEWEIKHKKTNEKL